MLRRAGFAPGAVARSVTLVSLWNQFANLTYPIVALFLLTIAGEETAPACDSGVHRRGDSGVAVAALVLVLYSNRMTSRDQVSWRRGATWVKGRFAVRRSRGVNSFERFRVDVVEVLKRRWHLLTLATFAGSLTVFAVLLVSLRALQVPSSEVTVVGVRRLVAARLLGSIPITPGGIGVVSSV
jgi:uncharacterized membrane protein YbhN (UPF0104 family)